MGFCFATFFRFGLVFADQFFDGASLRSFGWNGTGDNKVVPGLKAPSTHDR
jgi:hypothetical protein